MTIEEMRIKLHHYIEVADDKKVKAIYRLLETEIEGPIDFWKDKEFLNEMKSRIDDFESGRDPGILWEEVKANVYKSLLKDKD
jgi:hypothetical protein